MALSDSMFLFEIAVDDLESFMRCKEFNIKSKFSDVFTLYLKEPRKFVKRREKTYTSSKCKSKVRNTTAVHKSSSMIKLQTGQSALVAKSIEWLTNHMRVHPIELSLWRKSKKLGGARIPWSHSFLGYLKQIQKNDNLPSKIVKGTYNIMNEFTSKCMATITLSIKLTYLKGIRASQDFSISPQNDRYEENVLKNVKNMPRIVSEKLSVAVDNIGISKRTVDIFQVESETKFITRKKRKYGLIKLMRSDTQIYKNDQITSLRSKSGSSIHHNNEKLNPLTYIFGCPQGHCENRVYCVSYFTVENDLPGLPDSPKESVKQVEKPKGRYHLKLCDASCPERQKETRSCSRSVCSLDLPDEANHLVNITKCKQIECENKKHREPILASDHAICLNLNNIKTECCLTEKVEEIVGGVSGKMNIGKDPCFCTCECTFGFVKKTTYCTVCGGYEIVGDELSPTSENQHPFPCPIFHKLVDKSKLKNWSTSGSESKKKGDEISLKSMKVSSGQKAAATTKRQTVPKSVESEKVSKKRTKEKKEDRFKFNYGYKGIPPQIGHDECAMPCTGTLGTVPKNMGWLWTAENIPGMKFRPMWKPGAVNKHVLRLLRMAKNPGEVIAKKRRKDTGKKKRPLKRPLLIVHKRDGEYTVTMETMKTFSKPRAPNQHPYEDKPVLTYTIGRTDEENRDRIKKKERERRRLERAQRQFIQSAFRDMCQDICLKTYQQALGILPGTEDPNCPCYPTPGDNVNVDVSCSCSEEKTSTGSDTDLDEWIVEFTPPNATFDPTYKSKKVVKADAGSQYTYLDYKVKLIDRFGNPVPRFFKGPDGKQQCSDLGGFWSPESKWLEINVDGYVAPDGRWAPNIFIGPSGEQVDAEVGKFQATNGKWLVVGVDGYVDCVGKWRFYPSPRGSKLAKRQVKDQNRYINKLDVRDKKERKGHQAYKPSEASWSCFGDVSPRNLSRMGIVGHGHDKRILLSALKDMLARGEDVKIPQSSTVYRLPDSKRSKKARMRARYAKSYSERYKCHHPVPSDKGIIAMDEDGNKTYFRLKSVKNKRPKERLARLADRGISVSSFHVPCFHSFINSEIMKKQQRERLVALANKSVATQVAYIST